MMGRTGTEDGMENLGPWIGLEWQDVTTTDRIDPRDLVDH